MMMMINIYLYLFVFLQDLVTALILKKTKDYQNIKGKKKRNIYLIIVLKNNNYHIMNRNDIKNKT